MNPLKGFKDVNSIILEQELCSVELCPPRGHGAMSGNICGFHGWGAPGIEGVGAGVLLSPPQCLGRPSTE